MNFSGIDSPPLIQLLKKKLQYLQGSALETSKNIARADIPGQRRSELPDFKKALRHSAQEGLSLDLTPQKTSEQINREEETLAMTEISMGYQALTSIYKRYHDMIKLVMGKG